MGLFDSLFGPSTSDPIEIYNLGVDGFHKGSFRKAGGLFSRLLVPEIEDNLRMVAAYACHLCANQSGRAFPIPDDLNGRGDEVGVAYLAMTAAGRYNHEQNVCALRGDTVYVRMPTNVREHYFRIEFSSTLNVFSVEIFHLDDDSNSWRRMEGDELRYMPAQHVSEIAFEVGTGRHPPMPISRSGFLTTLNEYRPGIDDAVRHA